MFIGGRIWILTHGHVRFPDTSDAMQDSLKFE